MRVLGAYVLLFYGVRIVAVIPAAVRASRLAAAGGLVLALNGITMVMASLGVLLGLRLALAVAVLSVLIASALAAYNAYVLSGGPGLRAEWGRTIGAAMLVGLFIFGR